ncbi:hypothetical protein B0J13DRAFT_613259 [Dactylonectria estremocensis]|uniref:Zn(2)-C6 fungal-type domain-containing protein n=1 Tax=Dactylonectria estremocensis TaxID=1079267 RepID=A0A9P9DEB5_9HYPO|nr:hypothetical protein B0J13DRAFT_613259 [Dactylonectria estremocensis]
MRQKRACDACHKRKIYCDAPTADAQCNWCDNHGLTCTFNRVRSRRKPKNTEPSLGSERKLAERLERIENALARAVAFIDPSSPPASGATTPSPSTTAQAPDECSASLGEQFAAYESNHPLYNASPSALSTSNISNGQHLAGCHLGHITCHNGMPLFSEEGQAWILSRTGEATAFQKLKALNKRQQVQPPTLSLSHLHGSLEQLYELPDRSIVEQGIYWFQNSAFRLVFPAIDTVLFQDSVRMAYEPWEGPLSLERISAKGCVLAFLSIMCVFNGDLTWRPIVDSDACAVKAHYLLSDMVEDASIVTLQTVFMLHMHQIFSGRLQSAAMLHAVACRIIFMLGGHTQTNFKPYGAEVTRKEREIRHLRMIFWLCYIFDQDIALRTGQPPIMCQEHCDLTLPDGYLENCFCLPALSNGIVSPSFADESLFPYLPGDLRLGQLKGKTFRLLYSVQALGKSDAELLRDIRELDNEIETWRLSIPLKFRPALSISQHPHSVPEIKLPQSMQHIALRLEYHHLMATIHRASGRCYPISPAASFYEGERSGAIDSSLALALEASRSTLYYLQAAIDGLAGEAFWIIVFYPTAAIMILFFNVLLNPLNTQAKLDLELLSSAADLIRSMPIRRLTEYEIEHLKMVNDFVAELIRLGNCAICKAEGEREGEGEARVPRGHEIGI